MQESNPARRLLILDRTNAAGAPVVFAATALPTHLLPQGVTLDALKQRLRVTLARGAAGADVAAARRHAAALAQDGSWPDLDYRPADRASWPAIDHLERTLDIARARTLCPGELDDPLAHALDFWLARDFPAPDPWHHQIGVPRLIGSTALLCEDALSPGARGKVAEILARARWARWQSGAWIEWNGTWAVMVAFNIVLRGCLEGMPAWCQGAFERAYAAARIAPAGEDGIQADLSFRQDDAFTPADRRGLAFSENLARFLILGHGTDWQAPAECLSLFASCVLDGQQWMIRRRFFDSGVFDGKAVLSARSLDHLAAAVEELAVLGVTPRRSEMAAFARRLQMATEPTLIGHRHFWHLGLVVHQRPTFYASVRLHTGSGSAANGLTSILRRGDEYAGDGSVWDRRRLPGTTVLQAVATRGGDDMTGHWRGSGGGVTDGEYGVAVVELVGGVTGRKAWFHFDESVVCLGSGIRCEEAGGPVFTSINQCLSRGSATAYGKGGETHVLAPGKAYDLSAAHRLEHDGIVYHFPEPMPVRARITPQGGPRPEPGDGSSDTRAVQEVFSLWIDHGTQPRHETYAYAVLPTADADPRRMTEHEISQIKILANTPDRQAVWHQGLHLIGVVFWEPGVVALPGGGRVAVNRPCILLGQDRLPGGMRLSIANPAREDATVHVEYASRCMCFHLPAGPRGGQSVTRVL